MERGIDVTDLEPRPARPVAYVTMQHAPARSRIIETLEHAGWAVIPQPTGFHLLHAIADVIDGKLTWLDPTLIVIDAYARGCAGTTIAAGLRDLGIEIPIVLVTTRDQVPPLIADEALRIVDADRACEAVASLASAWARDSPRAGYEKPLPHGSACTRSGEAEVLTTAARDPRFAMSDEDSTNATA